MAAKPQRPPSPKMAAPRGGRASSCRLPPRSHSAPAAKGCSPSTPRAGALPARCPLGAVVRGRRRSRGAPGSGRVASGGAKMAARRGGAGPAAAGSGAGGGGGGGPAGAASRGPCPGGAPRPAPFRAGSPLQVGGGRAAP
ncbi:RRM domain-containing protein [Aix galericulata]|nr:RRM domain-containing protein [Aix galericulata]